MTRTSNTAWSQGVAGFLRDEVMTPRFAGSEAFRLHIAIIALTPLTLGSILVDGVPYTTSLSTVTFAALVSVLAAVAFFLAGGSIINRVARHDGLTRTSLTVIAFGATEAIRTTVFSQTMVSSGAPLDMLLHHRLLGGSMTGMLVLGIVSLLSVDRNRYYADYARLIDRQQQLTRELEALNYTISRFIDELTTNVREVVDTALRPLSASERATSTKDVVDHIVGVSENVVRPLSREVSAALPRVDPQGVGQPRVSPRRVLELTTVVAPFQPIGMPLVVFMLFFSASLFLVPPGTGIVLITISVAGVWLSHILGALFLHPRMPHWPMHWRVVVATLVYSLGFLVSLAAIIIQRGYGTSLDRLGTIVYVLAIVLLVSWGIALIPAIREGQKEIIADMLATTGSVMQVRARNEVRLRREKQRLSSIIHGDIQAILMATALKLQKDTYSHDALHEVVKQAREAIVASLDEATDTTSKRTLASVQNTLTDFWQGIVNVSWEVAPELHAVVDGDPDLPEMLYQVVREAITNAAKHGRASAVHIELDIDNHNHVVCRVSDDGGIHPDDERPGSGTQFFQAVADTVTRERRGGKTVLTLLIPLPVGIHEVSVG
jgi:signal transduction histidine kinase